MNIFNSTKPIIKTVFIVTLFITCTLNSLSGQSFITTWNTSNPGTSNASSITIPTGAGAYNYDVDWNNDGVFDQIGIAGGITHNFNAPGIYTIRIRGNFPTITFNNAGDKLKIIEIKQWGSIAWGSMKNSFYGCSNLICTATDSPILSAVTDMSSMFRASGITGDFSTWNVSKVTDMSYLFSFATKFNSAINNWNVNNVTNMRGMFWGATLFNQPLNSWIVSGVNDMSFMFFFAEAFNQNLNSWDVGKVTNLTSTFSFATLFNGNISAWNVGKVIVMNSMFSSASAFDQNLGGWNISLVTDMSDMLSNTALSIDNYDNTLLGWESQIVKPNVTLGADGLKYCDGELARSSLIALDNWNFVGDIKYCPFFITTWNTANPGLSNATSITIPTIGGGYDYDVDWNNDGVFDQLGINGSVTHDFGAVGVYTIQIRGDFPRIYFDNTGDKDKIIDINRWGNIEWTDMSGAFYGCSNLTYSAIDAPDLSNVASLGSMFQLATNFNGDISNWDVSNVTNMAFMFHTASLFNQNLNAWDVSNVTDMSRMFYFASLFNSDLNNWNVGNVINMLGMFQSATSFNKNISNWNVGSVTNMSYMFRQASVFNQPLNAWNVSNVTNMSNMFSSANAFNQKLGGWNISNVGNMTNMLSLTKLSLLSYDATLIGWGSQIVQNGVAFGADGLAYCEGDAARSILLNSFAWTITGDSKSCAFITAWKTDNPGDSPNNAITIPVTGGGYNYDVDWNNDGVFDQFGIVGSVSHIFPMAGNYTIRIRGDFPRIFFNNAGDRQKLINIAQWGDIKWSSMSHSFDGCTNLTATATDIPDLSMVSDLSYMFRNAESFNGDVSNWDVSNISNMAQSFTHAKVFIGDVSNWNVSKVTDMNWMFAGTDLFNSDISNWDVSKVTNMASMFSFAKGFNSDISKWDVSSVTSMGSMFSSAHAFNSDISNWDVSSVTTMYNMFAFAFAFNSDVSKWDVFNVTQMSFMFSTTLVYNGNMSNWDVSNVTDMRNMFYNTSVFNKDISTWNMSNVKNISGMFHFSKAFNIDLSPWDVSNVEEMDQVFNNATAFNQNLGGWDISSVTSMLLMLNGCAMSTQNYDNTLIGWAGQPVQNNVQLGALNLTYCTGEAARSSLINNHNWTITGDMKDCDPFITTWKTDNPGDSPNKAITIPVIGGGYNYDVDWNNDGVFDQFGINGSVSHIFPVAGTYTIRIRGDFPRLHFNNAGDKLKLINIAQWGDIEWSSMENAFYGCENLMMTATDSPNLSNVTNFYRMFAQAKLFNGDLNNWDVSNVTNMSGMFWGASIFNGNVIDWDVSKVTNMSIMFFGASSFDVSIGNWDVSNATNMSGMFYAAHSFNRNISAWNVSNVTDMSGMFQSTHVFNKNLSNWNVSKVTNMSNMFRGAVVFNSDLSSWNVSNVINMSAMFSDAHAFNSDISNWIVSKVENMSKMFFLASSFNVDIGNWDVSSATEMWTMFANAYVFNQDLNNWNVSNVTSMRYMFESAYAFNGDISDWDVSNVTEMYHMFESTEMFNNNISSWDVSNVTDMNSVFENAIAFNQNLGGWDIGSVTTMEDMLSECAMSTENYDNTLVGWANQPTQNGVALGSLGLTYCAGEAARSFLINLRNWSITGDDLNCSALPIELIAFNAQVNDRNQVDLVWKTATEINNDYFTIERSKDGIQFESLTEVEGAGNSVEIISYSTEDAHPYGGISYYRLKQTDFDGTSSFSEVKSVNIKNENGFVAFPNPMQDVVHLINENLPQGPISIEIYDLLGKSHYNNKLESDGKILSLDINEVALFESGTYFLVVREGDATHSFKLIKSND